MPVMPPIRCGCAAYARLCCSAHKPGMVDEMLTVIILLTVIIFIHVGSWQLCTAAS